MERSAVVRSRKQRNKDETKAVNAAELGGSPVSVMLLSIAPNRGLAFLGSQRTRMMSQFQSCLVLQFPKSLERMSVKEALRQVVAKAQAMR
jgi:hypothetical protein